MQRVRKIALSPCRLGPNIVIRQWMCWTIHGGDFCFLAGTSNQKERWQRTFALDHIQRDSGFGTVSRAPYKLKPIAIQPSVCLNPFKVVERVIVNVEVPQSSDFDRLIISGVTSQGLHSLRHAEAGAQNERYGLTESCLRPSYFHQSSPRSEEVPGWLFEALATAES